MKNRNKGNINKKQTTSIRTLFLWFFYAKTLNLWINLKKKQYGIIKSINNIFWRKYGKPS